MERPFDTCQTIYTPAPRDRAIGTLTRRAHMAVGRRINAARPAQDMAVLGRLCRISNYLLRRERRLNAVQFMADGGGFPIEGGR